MRSLGSTSFPRALDVALRPLATLRRLGAATRAGAHSPHQIALGLAAGVFAAFPPCFGFQFAIAALLARLLGASTVAALAGTFAGNPLTWPAIWAGSYGLGSAMLGETVLEVGAVMARLEQLAALIAQLSVDSLAAAWRIVRPLLLTMTVGSVPLGAAAALAVYAVACRAIRAFEAR